jgi:hypothetical protein
VLPGRLAWPGTLTTRANIAIWTGQSGDPAQALRVFTELLRDRERGASAPTTRRPGRLVLLAGLVVPGFLVLVGRSVLPAVNVVRAWPIGAYHWQLRPHWPQQRRFQVARQARTGGEYDVQLGK